MSRGVMTMRAHIERPVVSSNAWNEAVVASMQTIGPIACRVWNDKKTLILDGDKTASVGGFRAVFPPRADIRAGDRIAKVTDRLGAVLFPGVFVVKTTIRRRGHLAVELESHVA